MKTRCPDTECGNVVDSSRSGSVDQGIASPSESLCSTGPSSSRIRSMNKLASAPPDGHDLSSYPKVKMLVNTKMDAEPLKVSGQQPTVANTTVKPLGLNLPSLPKSLRNDLVDEFGEQTWGRPQVFECYTVNIRKLLLARSGKKTVKTYRCASEVDFNHGQPVCFDRCLGDVSLPDLRVLIENNQHVYATDYNINDSHTMADGTLVLKRRSHHQVRLKRSQVRSTRVSSLLDSGHLDVDQGAQLVARIVDSYDGLSLYKLSVGGAFDNCDIHKITLRDFLTYDFEPLSNGRFKRHQCRDWQSDLMIRVAENPLTVITLIMLLSLVSVWISLAVAWFVVKVYSNLNRRYGTNEAFFLQKSDVIYLPFVGAVDARLFEVFSSSEGRFKKRHHLMIGDQFLKVASEFGYKNASRRYAKRYSHLIVLSERVVNSRLLRAPILEFDYMAQYAVNAFPFVIFFLVYALWPAMRIFYSWRDLRLLPNLFAMASPVEVNETVLSWWILACWLGGCVAVWRLCRFQFRRAATLGVVLALVAPRSLIVQDTRDEWTQEFFGMDFNDFVRNKDGNTKAYKKHDRQNRARAHPDVTGDMFAYGEYVDQLNNVLYCPLIKAGHDLSPITGASYNATRVREFCEGFNQTFFAESIPSDLWNWYTGGSESFGEDPEFWKDGIVPSDLKHEMENPFHEETRCEWRRLEVPELDEDWKFSVREPERSCLGVTQAETLGPIIRPGVVVLPHNCVHDCKAALCTRQAVKHPVCDTGLVDATIRDFEKIQDSIGLARDCVDVMTDEHWLRDNDWNSSKRESYTRAMDTNTRPSTQRERKKKSFPKEEVGIYQPYAKPFSDEPGFNPLDGEKDFKPRCIQGNDDGYNVTIAPQIKSVANFLKKKWDGRDGVVHYACRSNEELAEIVQDNHDRGLIYYAESDFSKYDSHQTVRFLDMEARVYRKMLRLPPDLMDQFCRELRHQNTTKGSFYCKVDGNRIDYEGVGRRASGMPNTSVGNTIINAYAQITCMIQGSSLAQVRRWIDDRVFMLHLLGDDMLFQGVEDAYDALLRGQSMYDKIGLPATMMNHGMDWHGAEFLRRNMYEGVDCFVFLPKAGRILQRSFTRYAGANLSSAEGAIYARSVSEGLLSVFRNTPIVTELLSRVFELADKEVRAWNPRAKTIDCIESQVHKRSKRWTTSGLLSAEGQAQWLRNYGIDGPLYRQAMAEIEGMSEYRRVLQSDAFQLMFEQDCWN